MSAQLATESRDPCRHSKRILQPHAARRARERAGHARRGHVRDRRAGGSIGAIDIVEAEGGTSWCATSPSTPAARSTGTRSSTRSATSTGVELLDATDRTFSMHEGGKIAQVNKHPLKTRDDLSMAYTPGVARVCLAIHEDPDARLPLHDQAELRRRRLRRLRGARPRRHRPAGRDARDGGQGDAAEGVRRRRRASRSASTRRDPDEIVADGQGDRARASAASTSRTSPRRAASRSRTA